VLPRLLAVFKGLLLLGRKGEDGKEGRERPVKVKLRACKVATPPLNGLSMYSRLCVISNDLD